MKKLLVILFLMISLTINAMEFDEAKEHALFIADKLKSELSLDDEQYEKCYEIYLDYFISIKNEDDLFGESFSQRNELLQEILLDWQYDYLYNAIYFYTPIYWYNGWKFPIYNKYPIRNHYIHKRPIYHHSPRINRNFRRPQNNHFKGPRGHKR